MMYYDRSLPGPLLDLLAKGGPLVWMVELARELPLAHVQFRCSSGRREYGGIQFYLGRTSPIEVLGTSGGDVEFTAHRSYRCMNPGLFGRRFLTTMLPGLRTELETHIRVAASVANNSFIDGEAVAHAGMMRRYGQDHRQGDLFLALDSEVRVGFGSQRDSDRFTEELRETLGLADKESLPKKLDALGILSDGTVGLIEVKDEAGDLRRAAIQAAAHVFRVTEL